MNNQQISNVSFLKAVFLRPKMYTLNGTYEEVIAFLVGFYSGMAKGNPNAPPIDTWITFQDWLSERLNLPKSEIFLEFRNINHDCQDLVQRMAELVSEFEVNLTAAKKAS